MSNISDQSVSRLCAFLPSAGVFSSRAAKASFALPMFGNRIDRMKRALWN